MRATITIKPSTGSTFALARYCVVPKPEHAQVLGLQQATKERLLASFGIGCDGIDVSDPASLSSDIDSRTTQLLSRKGKMHRHVVFSVVDEKSKEDAIAGLTQLGRDWQSEFCPQSKCAYYIHGDGGKYHMHAIVEAYDPRTYKRHDWDQRKDGILSKMQDMQYTKAVTPGKGCKLSKAEKEQYSTRATDRSATICSIKHTRRTKDSALARDLVDFVKSSGIRPQSESGLLSLLQHQLPTGWTLRSKSKSGKPLARPSISNGDTTVRLDRFWRWLSVTKSKRQAKIIRKDRDNLGR